MIPHDPEFEKLVLAVRKEFNLDMPPGPNGRATELDQLVRALAAARHQLTSLQFAFDMAEHKFKERVIEAIQGLAGEAWTKPWSALTRAVERVRAL